MNIHYFKRLKNAILYHKYMKTCDMTPVSMDYEQCISILESVHPDNGSGSILKKKRTFAQRAKGHKKDLLDIIIPAYNVESYIAECLDSALKQNTGYPFHIIVVNDGSTDHTADVLKRYEHNPKITIIHQDNKGLSGARNAALRQADARYIMFLDSDDRIPKDAVDRMLREAIRTKADIVAGSYCNYVRFRGLRRIHRQRKGQLSSIMMLTGHACEKIFRRKLFDSVCFPEGYWFEDSLMHQIIFPSADNIYGISELVYERRSNPASITHAAVGNPKAIDSVWVTVRLWKDRKILGLKADDQYYEYMLSQAILTQKRLQDLDEEIQKASFLIFHHIIEETFPNRNRNVSSLREAEYYLRKSYFHAFALFCKYR